MPRIIMPLQKIKGTIARLYKGILGGEKSNWIGLFQKSGKNDPDTYDIPGDIEKELNYGKWYRCFTYYRFNSKRS